MLEEAEVVCPYCGEHFTIQVDCSAGDQAFIQDCEVCCQPIQFDLHVGAHGGVASLTAEREDA